MNQPTDSPGSPAWQRGRVAAWLFSTDHKRVGALWIALAGVAALAACVPAVLARLHAARAGSTLLGEGTFEALTTYEGTLVAYGILVPLAAGLTVALVPLQVGARTIAAAPLVTGAFWVGAFGVGALVLAPFASGPAPRSGWTTSPHAALDATVTAESTRLVGVLLVSLALLATAVPVLCTVRRLRAPGMTWQRVPFFTQSASASAALLVPLGGVSALGAILLLVERTCPGTADWYLEGDALVGGYGWVFQQGVVVASLLVALGAAVEIVATFARGFSVSRRLVTLELVAAGLAVCILPSGDRLDAGGWVAILLVVAAAAAAKVALLALAGARQGVRDLRPGAPVAFALGALALFLVGAVVGVLAALEWGSASSARTEAFAAPALVALLGALVYWWPKLFGRAIDERPSAVVNVFAVTGALALVVGDATGTRVLATVGALALIAALIVFAASAVQALLLGRRVGGDPWLGDTLEWFAASPPRADNFASLPPVESARPLADLRARLGERSAR